MRRSAAAAAVCCVALLAGCAGGSAVPSRVPSTSPAPAPTATDLGFDPTVLDALAADAEQARSTCFLVARQGHVVLERYWHGGRADLGQQVFSVTKSVTSTLVGLAEADGDLALDDRASTYIEAWRGTPSETVTVRNLLANDSGRFWTQQSDYGGLLLAEDRTAYAVGLTQQKPPGRSWTYNNAAIQTLDAVLRTATGEDPLTFAAERLFEPLGMTHSRMTPDSSGRSTNVFFGLHSTCPDLARFGTLFAQDGEWQGEQLVPRAWVTEAVGQPSQRRNASYGLLWWLNKPQRLAPGAPRELYAAVGFGGQVVLVDPRTDTVVVRLGGPGDAESRDYTFADAARVVTEALRSAR